VDTPASKYLEASTSFANFLALRKHSSQEILTHISHRLFADFKVIAVALASLSPENALVITPQTSAFLGSSLDAVQEFSVFDENPLSESFRSNEARWSESISHLQQALPALKALENKGSGIQAKTVICTPVEVHGTPRGVFALVTSSDIEIDADFTAFVTNIGNILALYLLLSEPHNWSHQGASATDEARGKVEPLTDRQMLILQLMASGKTNGFISESLGYSESTVRQETIKIYSKLQCDGRIEASKIYKERFASANA